MGREPVEITAYIVSSTFLIGHCGVVTERWSPSEQSYQIGIKEHCSTYGHGDEKSMSAVANIRGLPKLVEFELDR